MSDAQHYVIIHDNEVIVYDGFKNLPLTHPSLRRNVAYVKYEGGMGWGLSSNVFLLCEDSLSALFN